MGSYQILGRFAKMQNAYDVRILRPARQPVLFYVTRKLYFHYIKTLREDSF